MSRLTRKESDRYPLRMLALISQLAITMMVALFFCIWLGAFLYRRTGSAILFLIFILLGILSGFRSCYLVIRRFISFDQEKEESDAKKAERDE